jgi:hypothetical protein
MGLQFEGFPINIDGRQQWKGRRQEGAPTINIEGSAFNPRKLMVLRFTDA